MTDNWGLLLLRLILFELLIGFGSADQFPNLLQHCHPGGPAMTELANHPYGAWLPMTMPHPQVLASEPDGFTSGPNS
jgi:hypothetical protein